MYFLYMCVTNAEGLARGVRVPPKIGVSTNPFKRVLELNGTDGFEQTPSSRSLRKGAPYWELALAIGPIVDGARAMAEEWAARSRKVSGRLKYGVQMAIRINECIKKRLSPEEIKALTGCVPQPNTKLVAYSNNRRKLMEVISEARVKPRKRPRIGIKED